MNKLPKNNGIIASKYLKLLFAFMCCSFYACKQNATEIIAAKDAPTAPSTQKIFEKLPAEKTNIVFSNVLKENLETDENLFNYDYFYNGGGVGVEDINNDGLPDIFFCGNQVANKLYLNKGNFVFEDISQSSGITEVEGWTNGVTFADINNDGWMDIYLSQGGPYERENRKNRLFINQKNNSFKESAEAYGLADMGISTQSVFFDYDKDGDLDCFVMNENEFYGVDPITLGRLLQNNEEAQYFNSSHLYEYNNGSYVDVTKKSGIQRPIFGLGLVVSDINNDNWLDIYVASDYYIPDALFINNGNGTFTDRIKEYTNQISFYGMGVDIADINNDGLQDIFVLDMASSDHFRAKTLMASMNTTRFDYLVNKAGYHHQYMYNSLQLNIGNNTFNNVSQLTGTESTDWSWSVLMSDFDLDSDNDIFVTNGYRRYALDNDLQQRVLDAKIKYRGKVPFEVKKELYSSMPSEKLPNILFANEGDFNFPNKANDWGLADFSFSNGAAQADLDNDGDLDLIVNNIDDEAFIYRNRSREENGNNYLKIKCKGSLSETFPKIKITYNGKTQFIEHKRIRGYRSAQQNEVVFGLSNNTVADTLQVFWENGMVETLHNLEANQRIVLDISNATQKENQHSKKIPFFQQSEGLINYEHQENYFEDFKEEILLPYRQSTIGPFVSKGDVNGDGLEDLYIGGSSGQSGLLYIQQNGKFVKRENQVFRDDRTFEDMESLFVDIDRDGDQDLFVVSGGYEFENGSSYYQDRLYLNDGSGNFIKSENGDLMKNRFNGKTVTSMDIDNDGDNDILVGNRVVPKNYPNFQPSILYENDNGQLIDKTKDLAPQLMDLGIINALLPTDFNQDGKTDLIALGEWTGIAFFENTGGKFKNYEKTASLLNQKGWWFSIEEIDINNDGQMDYVLGNVGHNLKFKPSKEKPLKVFAEDFDGNGSNDIVLSKKYHGQFVPVRGRECSSQQMPFIKEKFKTYEEFAQASLVDVYGEALNTSFENEANTFTSKIAINNGNGNFNLVDLPPEAQAFPIMDMETLDVNKDGFLDILLTGNLYDTEVETPRLDATSGIALLGGKDSRLELSNNNILGIYPKGAIMDVLKTKVSGKEHLLFFQNSGPIITYSRN